MTEVNKSKSPYYDDYNEEKNFHEILFRPRFAVQTRELNQIQTMFYEQISRFGSHVFEEGSIVIPGETNYDLDLSYVTLSVSNYNDISYLLIEDQISIQGQNGITAQVKLIRSPVDTDPLTFYLQYNDSSTSGTTSKFVSGDTVDIINTSGTTIGTGSITGEGIASKFTINNGVYYLNGRFVLVEKQTVLLDKYGNTPSKIVTLEYKESIVTENQDTSLFDNAQGTPNFTAPGAHRLKVDTSLAVYDLADLDNLPEDAVEIFRIDEGVVQRNVDQPQYAVLNDVLARRTYEESGDYTVKSFNIGFKEHSEVFTTSPDENKFVAGLEAGLAYVKGYRVETLDTENVVIDKARATGIINNSSISASLGYYIEVENLNIIPDVTTLQKITFYDSGIVTPGVQPSGSALGTARVRFVRDNGSTYRLYIFDIRDASGARKTGFITNALSVHSSVGSAVTADLVTSELFDPTNNSLVFPLNVDFVKSLNDEFDVSDTSYSSVKQFTTSTDSNGRVTISASTNEVFVSQDSTYAFASFTDTDEFVAVVGNYTLSGNPSGSVITFDFGIGNAGRPIRINAQVAKEQVAQKTKTTQTGTASGSLDGDGRLYLSKADVFEIESVIDNSGVDVTSGFTLYQNKTLSFYGISYVTGPATGPDYPVTVTFKYFQHSAGDYFGPDSYVDVDYDDVPTENGIRLSDVLDFRPRIADDNSGFSGAGTVVGNIPTPFTIVRADIEHYLPRIDKIYVDVEGNFGVTQGVPALEPKKPEDPADAMVLYVLNVPAYTFDTADVQAEKISNRRYTMKDIGRLENRLSNIEYYVSLNLLEQEAESTQIIDPQTGLNRFKNGFLTDAFVDHSVGDFAWEHYHVSVEDEGALRPEFSLNAFDLEYNEAESSNVVENSGMITLPYTHRTFIAQRMRSETMNVNPYAIFRWEGDIELSPSIDSWIDTNYASPEVTYRVFNNGDLTKTWKSWQLNWTGGSTSTTETNVLGSRTVTSTGGFIGNWGTRTTRRLTTSATTTTTTRTNVDVVNDRVIDTSVIPYMRSIEITIEGVGHRPATRLHFFFDRTKVNQYVKPVGGSYGQAVKADADGNFTAVFRIPNSSSQRFRTGEKKLAITDTSDGVRENSTSWAESTFTSSGIRRIRRQTIVATRSIRTSTSIETNSTTLSRTRWRDPLAQSFLVEREGGIFVTKIDTFFAKKDSRVPVNIEIREMENGAPTQRIVPGAKKTLNPSQVSTSSNGSVATTFEFPHPIYLSDGTEYCFVVWSNSNNYETFIARMGARDMGTGKYIVEQPYAGVLFKSQNNSTWTADQTADLQFEIYSAKFDTNVTGELITNNADFDDILLPTNPIDTTSGSNEIVINRKQHNYIVGGYVEIKGAIGGNNIPATEINGTHEVTEVVNPSQIKIQVTTNANASGEIGGAAVEISDTVQASLLNPNVPIIELSRTKLTMEAKGTTGKSIDGTENPYQALTDYIEVSNEAINELDVPWVITNSVDETQSLAGNKSYTMKFTMTSDNDNVSPVVDMQGNTVITPFALITKPGSDVFDGTNNWANYRTKITGIKNPANALRVYIDADKPQGSDILVTARFGNSQEEIEDADWVEVTSIVSQTSGSAEGFLENEFGLENIDDYTLYQIMIQLKSDSSTRYPVCKRLRALALGT